MMNRRTFLTSTLAVGAVALTVSPLEVFAQAPDAQATPDSFGFDFDGRDVSAARAFDAAGLRMEGGMKYSFSVDHFDKEDHAKDAFSKMDEFVDGYFKYLGSKGQPLTVGEIQELSAPKLGKDRKAITVPVTFSDLNMEFVMLFAYEDTLLHRWFGVGLANPAEEFFGLTEKMTFKDVDESKDDELLALIPSLEDMPVGFTLADEAVQREDS